MRHEGTVSTLQELHRTSCWWWAHCTNSACLHRAPVTIVPLIIRWGPEASSNRLRQSAKCARCGRKGVTLQHPSWCGSAVGWGGVPGRVEWKCASALGPLADPHSTPSPCPLRNQSRTPRMRF
jgi:hypothetical protein